MSYSSAIGHRVMVFDDRRNAAYADAIAKTVNEKSIVIDLGAGIGIHGLMAAKAGAKKVYLVEPEVELDIATKVALQNELSHRIVCVGETIEQSRIPERVDIIISVFTGNFLLEEDLLPSLFYARDNYLEKGGRLVPDRAKMEVVPVTASKSHSKLVSSWSEDSQGLDFSLLRGFAANAVYYDDYSPLADNFLSDPVVIHDMNLMTATDASCDAKVQVTILEDGICHGWLGWFQIRLGDDWLSTSPQQPKTHWSQAFLPLDPPLPVKAGEVMSFELKRPEFGEWTWLVEVGGVTQRHSTFLSMPLSRDTLEKRSDDYRARINSEGRLAAEVLAMLGGEESTLSIALKMAAAHPDKFPDQQTAKRFIAKLIDRYC